MDDVSEHGEVVLGMAFGLASEDVLFYARSLRMASTAELILFVDSRSIRLPSAIARGIHLVVHHPEKLPQPWTWYHPSNYRYFLYQQFLLSHPGRYHKVVIADVRDVFYQSDPFKILGDAPEELSSIHVFLEQQAITIETFNTSQHWIQACNGGLVRRLVTTPISRSGFTVGWIDGINGYLSAMVAELASHQQCTQNGSDQGVHNVLVSAKQVLARGDVFSGSPGLNSSMAAMPIVHFHRNEDGPVFTGGYAPKEGYMRGPTGEFLNQERVPYVVLHQYDRHPQMIAAIKQRMNLALPTGQEKPPRVPTSGSPRATPNRMHQAFSDRHLDISPPSASQPNQSTSPPVPPEAQPLMSRREASRPRRAFFFNVQMDPSQAAWFVRRSSGELQYINSLVEELERLGWEVRKSGVRAEVYGWVDELVKDTKHAQENTLLFLDRDTMTNFVKFPYWNQLKCSVRLLDFFGTPPGETRLMESGLQLQQYLTPYPNQWNTHLGFPVQVHPPTPKERYAVLWGKNSKYFQDHMVLIEQLAKLTPLHAVMEDGGQSLKNLGVQVHSLMHHTEWLKLVARASYMIGFGDPVVGPSVMHSVAVGTVYLDCVYSTPRKLHTGIEFASQHPYAATFGPPHVYQVYPMNMAAVLETVKNVLDSPPPAPFMPLVMTPMGYRDNVQKLMSIDYCSV
eukprot:CAMPEP_0114227820 /NCGR_PEP_ID=MMETSP0058-20121206/1997_1 /TAXON_ID=36894 /ORGANISM="Pyramimonas parkeae, CCMP726" /LENGTH=679 /DNA_ID=CAMNT_0001338693 /DNA_START=394 /DNA_END=2433 /DNA_ORIENTATION=-